MGVSSVCVEEGERRSKEELGGGRSVGGRRSVVVGRSSVGGGSSPKSKNPTQ